ncbi:MAG: NUDIX domain-containing protein [bacterium]
MYNETGNQHLRVSALVIRDKKLLLVSDDKKWYWTPGGRIEAGETLVQAIERELEEEINVKTSKIEEYFSYTFEPEQTAGGMSKHGKEDNFLVEIDGEINPGAEINHFSWHTADEILDMPILNSFKEKIIKRLVKDGLL